MCLCSRDRDNMCITTKGIAIQIPLLLWWRCYNITINIVYTCALACNYICVPGKIHSFALHRFYDQVQPDKQRKKMAVYMYISDHCNHRVLQSNGIGQRVTLAERRSPRANAQLWTFRKKDDGRFTIASKEHNGTIDSYFILQENPTPKGHLWRRDGNFIVFYESKVMQSHGFNLSVQQRRNSTRPPPIDQHFSIISDALVYFNIQNSEGTVLQSNGIGQAVTFAPKQSPPVDAQLWYFPFQDDGSFRIVSKHAGVLHSSLILQDVAPTHEHQWTRDRDGQVIVKSENRVMQSDENGISVVERRDLNPPPANQQFSFISPTYRIYNETHNMVLGMSYDQLSYRQVVPQPTYNPSQLWYLEQQPDGTFIIISNCRKFAMEGIHVAIFKNCDRNVNQKFKMEMVNNRTLCIIANNGCAMGVETGRGEVRLGTNKVHPEQQFLLLQP